MSPPATDTPAADKPAANKPVIDDTLGTLLLAKARQAIGGQLGRVTPATGDDDARLTAPGATFVTLTRGGALRGCIGSLQARRTLGEDIAANAVAAATRDIRFPPVTADEFDGLRIEVSLLSDTETLDFDDEDALLRLLRPGQDGLILFAGSHCATFLPQVWEQLPEPRHFLAALKQKAGLLPDQPTPGLKAARYTVHKWYEPDRPHESHAEAATPQNTSGTSNTKT